MDIKLGSKVVLGKAFKSIQLKVTLTLNQGHRMTLDIYKIRTFAYFSNAVYCKLVGPLLSCSMMEEFSSDIFEYIMMTMNQVKVTRANLNFEN